MIYLLKMVMFHSYVKSPEGISTSLPKNGTVMIPHIYICVFKLFLIKFWDRNFKKPLVCKDWSRPKNTKVTWDYPGETRGNLRFFSAHGKAMAILAMLGWLWHMISSDPPKLIWFSSPIFLTVCLLECSAISSSSTAKKTFPSSYQAGGMCSSCTHASP